MDTNEDVSAYVSPVLLRYASITPLLGLLDHDAAALVLLWVYKPKSSEETVKMWCEIARYETWARQETKELLDYLRSIGEKNIPPSLYEVSLFSEVSTSGGLRTMRRNTLFFLIIKALKKIGLKRSEAIRFLEHYHPGTGQDKIDSAMKMVRKVLKGDHLEDLQEKKARQTHAT